MKLDPRHLHMLWTIVEAGGLSEAARRLGKSQPSLSRSLAEFEARLGAPLFVKGKRPLRPTELGLSLAKEGETIAAALDAAARAAQNHSSGHTGTLRVGGTPVFMDGVVSQMLAGFQTTFPGIHVNQSYGYLADLLAQLDRDEIDLAICPVTQDGLPDWVRFLALLPGRNVIASSASHPLARKSSIKLDDIAPYPWIAPPPDSPLFRDLRQVLSEIGIQDIQVSFSGGSLSAIINVLTGSEALTILPHSVLYLQRQAAALHALPIRISHPERTLGLLRSDRGAPKPVVRRLESYLTQQFEGLRNGIANSERRMVWKA